MKFYLGGVSAWAQTPPTITMGFNSIFCPHLSLFNVIHLLIDLF